jgi:hypothetical protein
MTQAEYLIGRFGSMAALARSLELAPSVVQGWKERGVVPSRRLHEILAAGQTLNPPLRHREFFESLNGVPHPVDRNFRAA